MGWPVTRCPDDLTRSDGSTSLATENHAARLTFHSVCPSHLAWPQERKSSTSLAS